jgi:hypothetical protein
MDCGASAPFLLAADPLALRLASKLSQLQCFILD